MGSRMVGSGDMDIWRSLTCNSSQDDATLKCWGSNGNGELGQGDMSTRGDDKNGGCLLLLYSRYRSQKVLAPYAE